MDHIARLDLAVEQSWLTDEFRNALPAMGVLADSTDAGIDWGKLLVRKLFLLVLNLLEGLFKAGLLDLRDAYVFVLKHFGVDILEAVEVLEGVAVVLVLPLQLVVHLRLRAVAALKHPDQDIQMILTQQPHAPHRCRTSTHYSLLSLGLWCGWAGAS